MLEDQARDKGLTFNVNLMPELPRIMADPSSMEQVLINLLSNAIRYTPPQGHIEVSSGVDADYIQFAVADSGIGIDKKDLDKIFDRFYRVKSERTRSIVGTGLGLPIAKAIVEDHLGFIRVESEPDKGSVFKVLLPIMV
jgi:signal transduction histidine kinase